MLHSSEVESHHQMQFSVIPKIQTLTTLQNFLSFCSFKYSYWIQIILKQIFRFIGGTLTEITTLESVNLGVIATKQWLQTPQSSRTQTLPLETDLSLDKIIWRKISCCLCSRSLQCCSRKKWGALEIPAPPFQPFTLASSSHW